MGERRRAVLDQSQSSTMQKHSSCLRNLKWMHQSLRQIFLQHWKSLRQRWQNTRIKSRSGKRRGRRRSVESWLARMKRRRRRRKRRRLTQQKKRRKILQRQKIEANQTIVNWTVALLGGTDTLHLLRC